MTLLFRIILIVVSVAITILVLRRVARSRAKIEDSIFWLGLCLLFIILSVFPNISVFFADLIGVQSSVNFIFLFFIFVLIMKLFSSSIRISKLEMQVQELSQAIAIHEKEDADGRREGASPTRGTEE